MTKPKPSPTPEQLEALKYYARVHGRYWKSSLSAAWASGQDVNERDGALLRQIRNTLGPSWLRQFNL